MSTTATSAATSTSSSAASSAKARTFSVTFGIVGTITYVVCLFFNWPLFSFHPATNRIVLGWEAARSGEGPVMYWYGWTATAVIVAAVLGMLATLLPESTARKIPLALVWLVPLLAIPYFFYSLMPFWTHP